MVLIQRKNRIRFVGIQSVLFVVGASLAAVDGAVSNQAAFSKGEV